MWWRIAFLAGLVAGLGALVGCGLGPFGGGGRAEWRGQVEAQCLASGAVRPSAYVQPLGSIDQSWGCGLERPFRVSAALDGKVAIDPPATIGCPMIAALDRWVQQSVQPAAYAHYREPVVGLHQIASYSCRTRDNISGAKLSEHAFGNAVDIAGFRLADGREIVVARDWWHGNAVDRAFLRDAFAGACGEFYTVLGPGSDSFHWNHFHLDLLLTNADHGRHYCRPRPVYAGGRYASARDWDEPETTGSIGRPHLIPFTGDDRSGSD